MTGHRSGRWTVVRRAGYTKAGAALWFCCCDCGVERAVVGAALRSGATRSCGCLTRDVAIKTHRTHGEKRTRIYRIWANMKARCSNAKAPKFPRYGGRGITVCDQWMAFEPFRDWALKNGYEDGLSIERMDNDAGYAPENCTWADAKTQARNTAAVKRDPTGRPWFEIAEENGVSVRQMNKRVAKGWTRLESATRPIGAPARRA